MSLDPDEITEALLWEEDDIAGEEGAVEEGGGVDGYGGCSYFDGGLSVSSIDLTEAGEGAFSSRGSPDLVGEGGGAEAGGGGGCS